MKLFNKKGFLAGGFMIAAMLYGGSAAAETTTIMDNYYGGDWLHGSDSDVYGYPSYYDIQKMDVDIDFSTGWLTVDIYTSWDPDNYPSSWSGDYYGDGVYAGDLFISVDGWDPYGSGTYQNDTSANGEDWEYAFDNGDNALVTVAGLDILESDDLHSYSGRGRDDQEALVDRDSYNENEVTDYDYTEGGLTVDQNPGGYDTLLSYKILLSDLGLTEQSSFTLGFHWALSCANDVIEGSASHNGTPGVPAPGVLSLLALGFMLPSFRRRILN